MLNIRINKVLSRFFLLGVIILVSACGNSMQKNDMTDEIQIIENETSVNEDLQDSTDNNWKEVAYPPSCEEAGVLVRENIVEGYTVATEGEPPLGHEYGEWERDASTGMMVTTCARCGKQFKRKEPYTELLPRIDFYGSMEGISKADRVTLQFEFASPTHIFGCYSYTTWQGHTTLNFPKKNYTIRLFDDKEVTHKHRVVFNNWQLEHKYVLKANYRDVSQARNLIAADLWADMAASRPNLFETLKRTSNYGAIAGFPVIVYLNDEFHGLYTMNLHIDDDLYQMDNAYDAVMITNSSEPDETRFYAEASFEDQKNAWEVEFCGTGDNDQWAKDSLNELIRFVMTSDDQNFKEHLKDYLDVYGAIDYLLFLYVTGLSSNASKDLVLLKYHDCDVWIPSVYDMEGAFGLDLETVKFVRPDSFIPSRTENGIWDSCTRSKLWDRVLQCFFKEVKNRYSDLRGTSFTEENLCKCVADYFSQIPDEYYKKDAKLYVRNFPVEEPAQQINQYIQQRLMILDRILKGNNGEDGEEYAKESSVAIGDY